MPGCLAVQFGHLNIHQYEVELFLHHLGQRFPSFARPVWSDITTPQERDQLLAALAKRGRWVTIYFGWRPNLPDEADNHLIELAIAGGASAIITHSLRDLGRGELRFGRLAILTPAQFLEVKR